MLDYLDISDLISLSALSFIGGMVLMLTTFKLKIRFRQRPEGLF